MSPIAEEISLLYIGVKYASNAQHLTAKHLGNNLEMDIKNTLADGVNSDYAQNFDVVLWEDPPDDPIPKPSPPVIALADLSEPSEVMRLLELGYHSVLTPTSLTYLPQSILNAKLQARFIAEAQQAERIMQLSERRYRRLFESAHDPIIVLNGRNLRIIDANPEALGLLGIERHGTIGRQLTELVEISPAAWGNITQDDKDAPKSRNECTAIVTPDGRNLIVDLLGSHFSEGNHRLMQISIRDRTEKHFQDMHMKQTLQQLEASEERFRLLSNQSPTPTLIVELTTGRIQYANPKAQEILGETNSLQRSLGDTLANEVIKSLLECGILIDYPVALPDPQKPQILLNGELSVYCNTPVGHFILQEK